MTKIGNIIGILILSMGFSFAQEVTMDSHQDSDPEAKKILDVLKTRFDDSESSTFDFNLEMEFPGELVESQEGKLVKSGEKFVLSLADQEIYSDNESMWVFDKSINSVQIYDADFGDDGSFMSPNEFLDIYNSPNYSYAITNEWMDNKTSYTHIEFKPLKEDSEYFKVRLEIKGKNHDIGSIKVFAKDGSRYTLHIKEIAIDQNFPQDYFVFNPEDHENIQVENLRID